MNPTLARKKAAANLGTALHARHQALALAVGEDEISKAAVDLGKLFNDNIEFIIWLLKHHGGLNPVPYQPRRLPVASPGTPPAIGSVSTGNTVLPVTPGALLGN
jgi:hypothetical protein